MEIALWAAFVSVSAFFTLVAAGLLFWDEPAPYYTEEEYCEHCRKAVQRGE